MRGRDRWIPSRVRGLTLWLLCGFAFLGGRQTFAAAPAAGAPAIDLPVESRFDADLDGWTPNDAGTLTWDPGGIGSGGFALFEDLGVGTGRILAPPSYLGNWAALDGNGTLSWYHRIVRYGGVYQVVPPTARLTGPGGVATWTAGVIPDSNWTYVSASIDGRSWTVESGSWSAILANVTELAIQAELVDNSVLPLDQDGIDNVRLARSDPAGTPEDLGTPGLRVYPESRAGCGSAGRSWRRGILSGDHP